MAVKRAVKKAPPKKAVRVVPGRATPPTGMPPTAAQPATPATPAAPAQGGFAERIAAFRAAMAKKKGKR